MHHTDFQINLTKSLNRRPQAQAVLKGSDRYPTIRGTVRFYQTPIGVLVFAEVMGLPDPADLCNSPIFAFHIHSGNACTGNADDPFANAGTHYDPDGCPHPYHAGDLPPLFGVQGYAVSVILTDRITVREILGKTVVIHEGLDDFSSQPAGNAGDKIACGQIVSFEGSRGLS